jgi:hypothetical protein
MSEALAKKQTFFVLRRQSLLLDRWTARVLFPWRCRRDPELRTLPRLPARVAGLGLITTIHGDCEISSVVAGDLKMRSV